MNYFALQKTIEPGSPAFLNGLLHDRIIGDGADIPPDYPWYWVEPGKILGELPIKVYFHTKDPLYLFDIRSGNIAGDFFVSDEMLDVLNSSGSPEFQRAQVELVSNHASQLRSKNYHYLRFGRAIYLPNSVIDQAASALERRRNGEIKRISKLTLTHKIYPPYFMISEMSIIRVMFFSEELASLCKRFGPIGAEFIPSAQAGTIARI